MNEEAKKTRDLTRKAKKNGKMDKIHLKLWTNRYMVSKDEPKLREVLGLKPDCSYEELFSKLKLDYYGNECDLEGYEDLKKTDEWIDLGKNYVSLNRFDKYGYDVNIFDMDGGAYILKG